MKKYKVFTNHVYDKDTGFLIEMSYIIKKRFLFFFFKDYNIQFIYTGLSKDYLCTIGHKHANFDSLDQALAVADNLNISKTVRLGKYRLQTLLNKSFEELYWVDITYKNDYYHYFSTDLDDLKRKLV